MKLDTYTVIYFICNFFTIFIIHRFFSVFYSKYNCKPIIPCVAYFMFFVITSLAYIFVNIPISALVLNWILIFVISLTYESTMQKRLIYTTYIIMFMLAPELIIGAVTGYFQFSFFAAGSYSNAMGIIATKLITYTAALLLKNFKYAKNHQNVSWATWISSIIIPIASLVCEIILVSCSDLTKFKAILSVIIIFIINVTAFLLYDAITKSYIQKSKVSILERENELYSKQCEIMQTTTLELQSFRHDMNNQFIALSNLLSAKKYDDAETQLKKLSQLTKEKILYSTSGNVIIDGLINYKLQNAVNDNIKINLEIAVPAQLPIDTTDIVNIVGNLLDNAISAVLKTDVDKRYISIKIVFSQQRLIIRITNPHKEDIRCENGRIISTKDSEGTHGLGISNVSKAVDKYNGYMEINHDNGIFIVDIIMYI